MTSNGSGPEASETKKERWWSRWWARWLAFAIPVGGVIYLLVWYVPDFLARRNTTASATVLSAWIGAVAILLGVGATAAVAIFAFWYSRKTNQATIDAAKDNLEAQRDQLDSTLTRTLNERFATAAGQLGGDKPPSVRLAGVYAMAGLADDWPENRQTYIDVLCAYLRLPYDPDPGDDVALAERAAYRADREVRHTVIRVIAAHLKAGAAVSWQGLDLDFTGVVFDGGDFTTAEFSGGTVRLTGAEFSCGKVYFTGAKSSGSTVSFLGAKFVGSSVSFVDAEFSGGEVFFTGAEFSGGEVYFIGTKFSGGEVSITGILDFDGMEFSGGEPYFNDAKFSGGRVSFGHAVFSGGRVDFDGAEFSGGEVDFSGVRNWSVPPAFAWTDTPPPGVKLPKKEDQSQE